MAYSTKGLYSIFFGTMFLLGLFLSVYQSVIGDMSGMLGSGSELAGIMISIYFTGAFIVPIIAGELGDRIGKKNVLLAGVAVIIMGLTVAVLSHNVVLTGIGVFFMGGGACTIESLLSAKITDENPNAAEKFMNYSQVFFCLGAVLGPLLSLTVKSLGGVWQVNMYIVVFLYLIVGGFLLTIPNDRKTTLEKRTSGVSYSLTLMRDIRCLVFFFSMFLYVGGEAGVAFFVIDYFRETSVPMYGEISLSLFWASMIVGRLLAGMFYRHSGKIMAICLVVAAFFSLLLQLGQPPAVIVFFIFMTGFGLSAVWPIIMAQCTRIFYNTSGTAGGLMTSGGALGGMLMPVFMGFLAAGGNVRNALLVVPAAMLITLILNLYLWKKKNFISTD